MPTTRSREDPDLNVAVSDDLTPVAPGTNTRSNQDVFTAVFSSSGLAFDAFPTFPGQPKKILPKIESDISPNDPQRLQAHLWVVQLGRWLPEVRVLAALKGGELTPDEHKMIFRKIFSNNSRWWNEG